MFVELKLSWSTPRMLGFSLVNSFMLKENGSVVVWCVERAEEMGSTVKVAMVIMASGGAPMGVAHRVGTGEFFCIMWLSTRIVLLLFLLPLQS